jgi:curved DNA-binding protein CbpA
MTLRNRRNYYRLLQVQPDAPTEVIRASYRTLMRDLKLHPDLGGETFNAALLNEAYATLSNSKLRADYDQALFSRRSLKSVSYGARSQAETRQSSCLFCKSSLPQSAQPADKCSVCKSPLADGQSPRRASISRRELERIRRTDTIHYFSSWPQEPREARMLDVSPKGMRFLAHEPLEPGSLLKISGPGFRASAVVINVSGEEKSRGKVHEVGVSFLATEFDSRTGSFLSTTA